MVAVVVVDTAEVVTVKVVEVEPAGTVTDVGGDAEVVLDPRVTAVPPGPAAPVRVTVPVELVPPTTVVGETLMLASPAAVIVRVADFTLLPSVP